MLVWGSVQDYSGTMMVDHTLPPIIMVQSKIGVSPSRLNTSMTIWMFLKIGVSQNGWFMENPIRMDDLGVPLFFGNTHMEERVYIIYPLKNCGFFLGLQPQFWGCNLSSHPHLHSQEVSSITGPTDGWMDVRILKDTGKHAELKIFGAKNDQIDETWSGEW